MRPPEAALGRGKAMAYSVILAAGVAAAIWAGVQYVNSRSCDTCARKRAMREAATTHPLIENFVVPVLRYAGDDAGLDALRTHAVALRARGYVFVSVSQIAGALQEHGRLPERCVAIAVEVGGKLPVPAARAIVADAGIPLSVFVNPARAGNPGTLTWEDMMELQAHGAEFHCLAQSPSNDAERIRAALRAFRNKTHRTDLHLMAASARSVPGAVKLAASTGVRVVWYPDTRAVRADGFRRLNKQTDRAALMLPVVTVADRTDDDEIAARVAVLTAPPPAHERTRGPSRHSAGAVDGDGARATSGVPLDTHKTDGGSAE